VNREEKLKIAKMAYKEIMQSIQKFESQESFFFCAHWDECISVDDELFHGHELNEKD